MRIPKLLPWALSCVPLFACGGGESAEMATASESSSGADLADSEEEVDDGVQMEGLRGTLSQDEIQMSLEPRMLKFANCVAKRTGDNETIAGNVGLAFLVSVDGSVGEVKLTRSEVGDRRAERCILKVARKVRFPDPHGGEAEFEWSFEVPADPEVRPPVPWTATEVATVLEEQGDSVRESCGTGYEVTVYVNTDGSVLGAGAVSESGDEASLDCVSDAVAAWTFPSPGPYPSKVTFPL